MRTVMMIVLILWLFCSAVSTAQDEKNNPQSSNLPNKTAEQVSRRQINQWIVELDADRFLARELATEKLAEAGAAAVDQVVDAMSDSNREIVTRGIHILHKIALSGDLQNEKASRAALEILSKPQSTFVARRAEATLVTLNKIRQERVIQHLKELGANFKREYRYIGAKSIEVSALFIGDNWGQYETHIEGQVKVSRNNWKGAVEDLQQLKYLIDIEYVFFTGEQVTGDWLKATAEMENLSYLVIKRASLTDSSIGHLRASKKLRYLEVRYVPLTDKAVEHLSTLPATYGMELCGTLMTEEGIEKLRNAPYHPTILYRRGGYLGIRLGDHNLGSQISQVMSDSAADKAGIKSGDVICRFGGQHSDNTPLLIALISKYRSKDKVEVDLVRGGQTFPRTLIPGKQEKLGIEAENTILGCHITKVATGSFAARLQLEPGDYVTSYGDRRFLDFKALENLYKTNNDEPIKFEILRGANLIKKTVSLGEWD